MFSSGKIGSLFFWVIVIFLIYCVAGTVYNYKNNGLKGVEALPNIDFWRENGQKAIATVKGLVAKVSGTVAKGGGGGGAFGTKGGSAGYSQI